MFDRILYIQIHYLEELWRLTGTSLVLFLIRNTIMLLPGVLVRARLGRVKGRDLVTRPSPYSYQGCPESSLPTDGLPCPVRTALYRIRAPQVGGNDSAPERRATVSVWFTVPLTICRFVAASCCCSWCCSEQFS